MERWLNKVALVTGASSGIGAAIAKSLSENGVKVVGLARRLNKMQDMQKHFRGTFYPVECDVTKEDDILKAFEWTKQKLGGIDILVNNAGIAIDETIIGGTTESYRKVLDVNLVAVAICTREAVKNMNERKVDGYIININSILGHEMNMTFNPISMYIPSKFALTALSALVQDEVDKENVNIRITNLSPGLVKTGILDSVGREHLYDQISYIEAKDIADAVLYVLSTPPTVVVSQLTIVPTVKKSN